MVALNHVLGAFSRRNAAPKSTRPVLALPFRRRIFLLLKERLDADRVHRGQDSLIEDLWGETHRHMRLLLGLVQLTEGSTEPIGDLIPYLQRCKDAHFLDFVEFVFVTDVMTWKYGDAVDALVTEFDTLFRADGLPFSLTSYVRSTKDVDFHGRLRPGTYISAFPKVVCRDNAAAFLTITTPALELLRDSRLGAANAEYLAALEEYRKGRYGDCLTKCGSAFESVMKSICHANRWPCKETDTAGTLLRTIIDQAKTEAFFEQPLLLIATLRNRLSTAHGAGTGVREPSSARTRYALNATAAAILFLGEECLGPAGK